MMKSPKRLLPLVLLSSFLSMVPCGAATLVEVGGAPASIVPLANAPTVTFTITAGYTAVEISANFWNTSGTATAYLNTSKGPGTTVASEVASREFEITSTPTIVLFSGLDLAPGTYHLTIHGIGPWWTSGGAVTTSGGATHDDQGLRSQMQPYVPASNFISYNELQMQYKVTGNLVPEPASATLALGGVAMLAFRRRVSRGV